MLDMQKFFRLHDYSENKKVTTTLFSLKSKVAIWWEDKKNVKDIHDNELNWNAFERLLKNNYLSKRYYDDIAMDFYELQMGSMRDEEHTSRFLELLRYVPYLREVKYKVQRFINGFLVACRD